MQSAKSGFRAFSLSACVWLAACGGDEASRCDWTVGFEDESLVDRAAVVEVSIVEGGCDGGGEVLYRAELEASAGAMSPEPPRLGPGRYGLRAVARDDTCTRYASGCSDVDLPCETGQRLHVPIAASSESADCEPSQCVDGRCGEPDGGAPDGGDDCPTGLRRCVDRCVDVDTSPEHCGVCDNACPDRPDATPTCTEGACDVVCDPGRGDCDDAVANGCETPLDTLTDCRACGASCNLPHATAQCGVDGCEIESCDTGWGDCNGDPSDGCEADLGSAATCGDCATTCADSTPLCDAGDCVSGCSPPRPDRCGDSCVDTSASASHCGGCDMACSTNHATTECADGVCAVVSCDSGWGDCNDDPSDGCETDLRTLTDCGDCGSACDISDASESCATGSCELVECDPLRADCNDDQGDGCETATDTLTDCGGCGQPCSLDHATETCATGSCDIMSCDDGWGDCDSDATTGCEVDVDSNEDHCGSCGNTCAFGEVCNGDTCECPGGCGGCNRTCDSSGPCVCDGGCECTLGCGFDGCNTTCSDSETACVVDVPAGASFANVGCEQGAACDITCSSTACDVACDTGARCAVDASGTSGFDGSCDGSGTTCDFGCESSSSCTVDCSGGAECVLRCSTASSCGFGTCDGGQMSCGGGVIACNRSCP